VSNKLKGTTGGQSLIYPSALSGSDIEECATQGKVDRESQRAVQYSIANANLRGDRESEDCVARSRWQDYSPSTESPRREEVPHQLVSIRSTVGVEGLAICIERNWTAAVRKT
jgi:hypothetical protein